MADKRVYDVPELTTPDDNDYINIIDVSDTTDSPQGSYKKIKKVNLGGGVTINDTTPSSTQTYSSEKSEDTFVKRSGTEVGKDIYGDLKFAQGVGIKTTETEEGLFTIFYNNNGLWTIIIDDGIDNPEFTFIPTKGFIANKLFDLDNDENAYIQKGHIVQLEEDVFNLELNKADLVGGLVPSSQLPAYVDDIIEGYLLSGVFYKENTHTTAITGEIGKIYVDLTTGQKSQQYRWSGTVYIQITNGLIASTDDVPEGSNLYFTTARVLATLLSGISFLTGGAIVSTDSVLVAFGKFQKQLNDIGIALGAKQATLTDTNFGTFTTSVADKNTQSDTDVLAYVDVTTGKWVKQTFTNLTAFLKGFFVDKTTAQSIDGVKTFTASPIVPTATSDSHAINFGQAKGLGKMHAILIDNNIGDIVQHTGTTMQTIVKSYVIPAGFFTSDCVFETDLTISKIGTAGNITIGFGIAPSGTTLPMHNMNATAGNQYINIGRKMTMIKNGLILGFGNSGNFYSDKIANGALLNKLSTFDPTISNTFNFSITLGNASDIALLENLTIKVYKNA